MQALLPFLLCHHLAISPSFSSLTLSLSFLCLRPILLSILHSSYLLPCQPHNLVSYTMQCVHLPHVLALPWESYLRCATEGAFNDSFRTKLLMFRLLRSCCHLHSPHVLHKDPLQLQRAQCMERISLLPTLLMYSLIIKLTLCVWLCVNLWIFPVTTGCLLNGTWSVSAFERIHAC